MIGIIDVEIDVVLFRDVLCGWYFCHTVYCTVGHYLWCWDCKQTISVSRLCPSLLQYWWCLLRYWWVLSWQFRYSLLRSLLRVWFRVLFLFYNHLQSNFEKLMVNRVFIVLVINSNWYYGKVNTTILSKVVILYEMEGTAPRRNDATYVFSGKSVLLIEGALIMNKSMNHRP